MKAFIGRLTWSVEEDGQTSETLRTGEVSRTTCVFTQRLQHPRSSVQAVGCNAMITHLMDADYASRFRQSHCTAGFCLHGSP